MASIKMKNAKDQPIITACGRVDAGDTFEVTDVIKTPEGAYRAGHPRLSKIGPQDQEKVDAEAYADVLEQRGLATRVTEKKGGSK